MEQELGFIALLLGDQLGLKDHLPQSVQPFFQMYNSSLCTFFFPLGTVLWEFPRETFRGSPLSGLHTQLPPQPAMHQVPPLGRKPSSGWGEKSGWLSLVAIIRELRGSPEWPFLIPSALFKGLPRILMGSPTHPSAASIEGITWAVQRPLSNQLSLAGVLPSAAGG